MITSCFTVNIWAGSAMHYFPQRALIVKLGQEISSHLVTTETCSPHVGRSRHAGGMFWHDGRKDLGAAQDGLTGPDTHIPDLSSEPESCSSHGSFLRNRVTDYRKTWSRQVRPGPGRSDLVRAGQTRSRQVRPGQTRSE